LRFAEFLPLPVPEEITEMLTSSDEDAADALWAIKGCVRQTEHRLHAPEGKTSPPQAFTNGYGRSVRLAQRISVRVEAIPCERPICNRNGSSVTLGLDCKHASRPHEDVIDVAAVQWERVDHVEIRTRTQQASERPRHRLLRPNPTQHPIQDALGSCAGFPCLSVLWLQSLRNVCHCDLQRCKADAANSQAVYRGCPPCSDKVYVCLAHRRDKRPSGAGSKSNQGPRPGSLYGKREGGQLVVSTQRLADPVALTSEVRAYTCCDHCRPVLYLRDDTSAWGDYVQERHPWCEWRLVFVAGALERRDAVRVETREAVAEQLRKQGLEVLDDDDRLARLHFNRRASRDR
jgi:hypothetical protein